MLILSFSVELFCIRWWLTSFESKVFWAFAVVWLSLVSFSDSSVGKESTCNAGDPSSIPGSGRSPGEGIGYPFQYSWASLVAQMVKNLPAMRETWVWSLGWEDPLEEGMAAHSRILAWRIPMDRSALQATELGRTERLSTRDQTVKVWKWSRSVVSDSLRPHKL